MILRNLLICIFMLGATACQKVEEAPLRMYTSDDPEQAERIAAQYKTETGKVIEYVRLSSGEVARRLRVEVTDPQASVWYSGSGIEYAYAASQGLFEPYKPKIGFDIPEKYRDKEWRWIGIYLGALAFVSNKSFLEKNKLKAPTSWKDLLRPEFKGKVGFALPYTSGTALTILLTAVRVMGEDAAFSYFRALDKQVLQYTKTGSACINSVGLGEMAVGIAFGHDIFKKGIEKGYPVEISFPADGTGYEVAGIGLIKGAKQAEEARKFIDWMLGPSGQKLASEWKRTPIDPRIEIPTLAKNIRELDLVDLPSEWATENQGRLVERWRKETGK